MKIKTTGKLKIMRTDVSIPIVWETSLDTEIEIDESNSRILKSISDLLDSIRIVKYNAKIQTDK